MAEDVELSLQGGVAFVRLKRPEKQNMLRGATFDQVRKIIQKLDDSPPQFAVISGEGEHFCAGLDREPTDPLISAFMQLSRQREANGAQQMVTRLKLTFDAISRLNCPVIVAIEGDCHGLGMELALAADLRVAAEGSSLRFDDGRYGLLTGLGAISRGMRLLGPARLMEAVMTGGAIPLPDARVIGLVNRLTPRGGALSGALELVQEMRKIAPQARKQTLLALRAMSKTSQELTDIEVGAAVRTWIAAEWPEALRAVKEGREPSW